MFKYKKKCKNATWKFTSCLFLEYFKETAAWISMLYELLTNGKIDKNTQELVDEFQEEYLKNGWRFISGVSKIFVFIIFILKLLFWSQENQFYLKSWYIFFYCTLY